MHRTTFVVGAGALCLALISGQAVAATTGHLPASRPLGQDLPVVDTSSAMVEEAVKTITGNLTLRQALAQAMLRNPELAAYSWSVRAKAAASLQAGLLPNPELEVGVENFGGNGEYVTSDNVETTVGLSQLLELGGKRSKRQAVASLEADLAGWDFEAKRLDVLTDTTKVFFAVLAKQEQLVQVESLAKLAEEFLQTVNNRVEAGKVSPIEASRAQVELLTAQIAQSRAQADLEAARKELATMWGDDLATFSHVVVEQEQVIPPPSLEKLLPLIEQNPDFARLQTEEDKGGAQVALEKSKVFPDLTVGVGVRMFEETDDEAMVAGISLPLPLFDRNQGGIAEAKATLNQVKYQRQAAAIGLRKTLSNSYRNLSLAYDEFQTLKGKILPAAEQAFEAAGIGYRAGKFSFIETLDAQRTLFEVNTQYVEALAAYHQARTDVERLTGTSLDEIRTIETKP